MAGAIEWDFTGKPYAKCPQCGKYHTISRRKDYLAKPVLRFFCKNQECPTMSWRATDAERKALLEYFEAQQGRGKGRPRTRPETQPKQAQGSVSQEEHGKRRASIWDIL